MTVDAGPRRSSSRGVHRVQVAETEKAQRSATAAWLDHELAMGTKVYYKGWLSPEHRAETSWLGGPGAGPRIRAALRSGQLEALDYHVVIERCGGTTAGLRALQEQEVMQAIDAGYDAVAMTQETSYRPLADDAEVAEFARQEGAYDELGARWPLRVLCQLTTGVENERHVFESLRLHHRDVAEVGWGAAWDDDRWRLRGELDAHGAPRFLGALTGALDTREAPGADGDLVIDLAEVEFVDAACAQMLVLAARALPTGRRIVLTEPPRLLRRLLDVLERPPGIVTAAGRPT